MFFRDRNRGRRFGCVKPAWNGYIDGILSRDGLPIAISRPTRTRRIYCSPGPDTRLLKGHEADVTAEEGPLVRSP